MTVIVPPIKSQGIKTKLVPWINELVCLSGLDLKAANWIEPFFGTGVVGMNAPIGGRRIAPHIIDFYKSVQDGTVTPQSMREYLQCEGKLLEHSGDDGYEHYCALPRKSDSWQLDEKLLICTDYEKEVSH